MLEFYFDVVCPFAYLASTQVSAFAMRAGIRVAWRPVLLGGILKAARTDPAFAAALPEAKRRHIHADALRFAEWYGVPFGWHPRHPVRTLLPMRALTALAGPDGVLPEDAVPAARALFAAHWARHEDTDSPEVLARILHGAGLDGAALVQAAESEPIKLRLRQQSERAAERGVFGVPTFIANGELVFGQDRWPFLAKILDASPTIVPYGAAPVGAPPHHPD